MKHDIVSNIALAVAFLALALSLVAIAYRQGASDQRYHDSQPYAEPTDTGPGRSV